MSTYIKLKSGSVSWGTNGLIAQVSERAPVRLVKEQGFLLINGYVKDFNSPWECRIGPTFR